MDDYTVAEKVERQVDRLFNLLEKCIDNEYRLIEKLDGDQLLRLNEQNNQMAVQIHGMMHQTMREALPLVIAALEASLAQQLAKQE